MTGSRRKTNFEPGMIFTLDHIKKDDLQFDVDAETARFREKKDTEKKSPPATRSGPRPKAPIAEPGLK
jgi:hypothetical protein